MNDYELCFAFKPRNGVCRCDILHEPLCLTRVDKPCPFFSTKEQYAERRKKAAERLLRVYGTPFGPVRRKKEEGDA